MRLVVPLLTLLLLALSAQPATAEEGGPPPPAAEEPTVEAQVQGTCRTPREAMLQLLYWIQPAESRIDRDRAAACLDTSLVSGSVAATRANQLKRTLDSRGVYVDVENIPADAGFVNATGEHRWRVPGIDKVEIVKVGNRWVFSSATVKAIPALHGETIPPLLERILDSLPAWFHESVLGVEIWKLFAILIFILFALFLQKIVVYIVATYVRRAAGKLALKWVDKAAERIARPIGGLVMAGVFYTVTPWLQLSVQVSHVARIATSAMAAFSCVWLAYRLVDVLTDWLEAKAEASASRLDDQLVPLLRKSLKVFIAVIGAIFLLQNFNVDVGSLLAGLGLGGLAFALAAKDTVANFFGSLVVFIDKPFQIGDWVTIDGTEGLIEEVGFRTTRVRTFYQSLVTIPNAKLTDTAIDNYGARRYRRYVANLKLPYDTPPERIAAFCDGVRGIVLRLEGMRRDYVVVSFNEYDEYGLNVMVYCFMDSPDWVTELAVRTNLNLEILRLAKDLGISFALPTRTLHVATQATPTEIPPRPPLDAAQVQRVVERYGPRDSAEQS